MISECNDEIYLAEILSGPIYNVINVINPHTLIMELDVPFTCENIFDNIKKRLKSRFGMDENDFPEFKSACCKFRNSHRGLTMTLRDMWLDSIVFGR